MGTILLLNVQLVRVGQLASSSITPPAEFPLALVVKMQLRMAGLPA